MHVNEVLSRYSDWSFTTATAIYVLAAIFYLAAQALSKTHVLSGERAESVQRELVTAGGATIVTEQPPENQRPQMERSGRSDRIARMAVALTVLGVLVHVTAIALRGFAVHRWPLGNMYEYIMFITLVAVSCLLFAVRKYRVRRLAGWVLIPVLVLMFLNGTIFYTLAAPVRPALQSYWLAIHVTIISASSGLLLIPGVASVLYLIRSANEHNPRRLAWLAPRLPAKSRLDATAYRVTVFALPLYTFGVMAGAIWAESAWGSFWSWDPKETTALVVWVCYAAYLHSRATAGWRGNRAAIINVLGFAASVFNLFFINLAVTGLHSYAGLS